MSASAQVFVPPVNMNPSMYNGVYETQKSNQRGVDDDERSSDDNAQRRLGFTPSSSVRQRNLARFVENVRRTDPIGAAKMAQLFAANDPIAAVEPELAAIGMKVTNVADALAYYWINAWEAAHGIAPHAISRAQAQAVSRQAAGGVANAAAFRSASDADKQQLAETMVLQAMMIRGSMQEAQANPALKPQIAAAVRQGAKAFRLDLDATRLTEDGFVPAGKRSEADIAEPAQTPTKAAAAPAVANDGEAVRPALWALGGAGALVVAYGLGKRIGGRG